MTDMVDKSAENLFKGSKESEILLFEKDAELKKSFPSYVSPFLHIIASLTFYLKTYRTAPAK